MNKIILYTFSIYDNIVNMFEYLINIALKIWTRKSDDKRK